MLEFISASPSPFHAVAEVTRRLEASGFRELSLKEEWPDDDGIYFVTRHGGLVAWVLAGAPVDGGFRLIGAHTDSPNLRVKPQPDRVRSGFAQIGVEVYGGALLNSWLDRDLGLSGRVTVRSDDGVQERLLRVDVPVARIPQLAIHLDREVNKNLKLDPQEHLWPVWGLEGSSPSSFRAFIAEQVDLTPEDVRSWDLMLHDLSPPTILGVDGGLVAAPRIDNQLSCWAGTEALISATTGSATQAVPVLCLFDHEEVGSASTTGAAGAFLEQVLERIVASRSDHRSDLLRSYASSLCLSADGAHATHPNYQQRSDPEHPIRIDGGPVVKVNGNQRYATDATTAAVAIEACRSAGVPHQVFVSRNDMPCGSTIGPLTATRLGIDTVDVGVAQLSMHSAREMCGVADPVRFVAALSQFLRS